MTEGVNIEAPAESEIIAGGSEQTETTDTGFSPDNGIMNFINERGLNGKKKEETKPEAEGDKQEVAGEVSEGESTEEEAPEEKGEQKTFTVNIDGSEIAVPESTELDCKVDGKAEKVSIAELKKNYAGKVAYDKKFQELSDDKKVFNDSVKAVDNKLNDIFKTITKGDPELGMRKLFKMAKKEHEFEETWTKIKGEVEEMATLSPEEAAFRKEKKQLALEREELEQGKKAKNLEAEEQRISQYAQDLMTKHDISPTDFKAAASAIKASYKVEDLEKMTADELVDQAAQLVQLERDDRTLDTIIKKVSEAKSGDAAFKKSILKVMSSAEMDFTDENIEFVAKELLGIKKPVTEENSDKAAPTQAKPGAPSKNNVAKDEGFDLGALVRSVYT